MHTCVWSHKSQRLRCSENHNRVHHGCGSLRKMSKVKNLWETNNGCSEEFLQLFFFFTSLQISLLFIRTCVFSVVGAELKDQQWQTWARVFLTWMHARRLFMLNENTLCFLISQMKRENANRKQVCNNMCWFYLIVTSLSYSSLKVVLTRIFKKSSKVFGIRSYCKLLVSVNLKLLVIRRRECWNYFFILLFTSFTLCHIF